MGPTDSKDRTGDRAIRVDRVSIRGLVQDWTSQFESGKFRSADVRNVPTGFVELDRLTSGWKPGNLVVVAARPGLGKTSFALGLACNAAVVHGRAVAIFAMGISKMELVTRMIACGSGISLDKLRTGNLSETESVGLLECFAQLENADIQIHDPAGLTISELLDEARRVKREHKVELIIIDELQSIALGVEGNSPDQEQVVVSISRSMKLLAQELGIPVIALSRLGPSAERRHGDKRPMLSDLCRTGALEQNADIVCFLMRPEHYKIFEDENGSTRNLCEVIVAKHRNGPLDTIRLSYFPELAKFVDIGTTGSSDDEVGSGSYGGRYRVAPWSAWDEEESLDDNALPF